MGLGSSKFCSICKNYGTASMGPRSLFDLYKLRLTPPHRWGSDPRSLFGLYKLRHQLDGARILKVCSICINYGSRHHIDGTRNRSLFDLYKLRLKPPHRWGSDPQSLFDLNKPHPTPAFQRLVNNDRDLLNFDTLRQSESMVLILTFLMEDLKSVKF
jgi:hypothetical protein